MLTKMIEMTDSILIGPGLGVAFPSEIMPLHSYYKIIQPHQNLIVDGDAITIFSKLKPQLLMSS